MGIPVHTAPSRVIRDQARANPDSSLIQALTHPHSGRVHPGPRAATDQSPYQRRVHAIHEADAAADGHACFWKPGGLGQDCSGSCHTRSQSLCKISAQKSWQASLSRFLSYRHWCHKSTEFMHIHGVMLKGKNAVVGGISSASLYRRQSFRVKLQNFLMWYAWGPRMADLFWLLRMPSNVRSWS